MKIYQIHAYGGQYEDRYDYIQSSYISREKAEHEKTLLEEKEYECELWDECPVCGAEFGGLQHNDKANIKEVGHPEVYDGCLERKEIWE